MALTQYGLHFGLCPKQSNKIEGVVLLQGVYFTNINHKGLQRTANEYDSRLMTHRIQIKSRLIFNSISSSAREVRGRVQCMRQINPRVVSTAGAGRRLSLTKA